MTTAEASKSFLSLQREGQSAGRVAARQRCLGKCELCTRDKSWVTCTRRDVKGFLTCGHCSRCARVELGQSLRVRHLNDKVFVLIITERSSLADFRSSLTET